MPVIKLNQTNEQREIEEAERLRAIEAEIAQSNRERAEKLAKYTRSTRIKGRLLSIFLVLLVLALIGFNVYYVFFKKETTFEDTFRKVFSTALSQPLYKESSLEGYLKENVDTLMSGYLVSESKNIEYTELDKDSIYIIRADVKSYDFADVYFSMNILTKEKDSKNEEGEVVIGEMHSDKYQFMIPISCDFSTKTLTPAGQISMVLIPIEDNTKMIENLRNAFDGIEELGQEQTSSARNFVETFLRTLYNSNSDISNQSDITRDNFDVENKTFVSINDFHIYSDKNNSGYNAFVDYTLSTNVGISYRNRVYLELEYSNTGTWKIKKLK